MFSLLWPSLLSLNEAYHNNEIKSEFPTSFYSSFVISLQKRKKKGVPLSIIKVSKMCNSFLDSITHSSLSKVTVILVIPEVWS